MSASNTMVVGRNIRWFREKLGLTQDSLAQYLGVHREVVAYYEAGSRQVPLTQLSRLAALFGVDGYDLLNEDAAAVKGQLAFAFRAHELQPDDLETIARFKKVVRNYLGMQKKLADA